VGFEFEIQNQRRIPDEERGHQEPLRRPRIERAGALRARRSEDQAGEVQRRFLRVPHPGSAPAAGSRAVLRRRGAPAAERAEALVPAVGERVAVSTRPTPLRPSPLLVGVVHLPALAGSPRAAGAPKEAWAACARDARVLEDAGFDVAMIENYGDVPFFRGRVPSVTVAAMTACAMAAREACSTIALGINVLRNDADAAL